MMTWWERLRRRRQLEEELEKELNFHLDQHAADLITHGEDSMEARRQAALSSGGPEQVKESCRDARGTRWLEDLARDFRFGFRMLNKYRTASLAAIASLALAIGASTDAFALIDALVLRPLPLPDPNRLIDVALVLPPFFSVDNVAHESEVFSVPQYELLRTTAQPRADLFALSVSGALQPAMFDDAGHMSENIRAESISGAGFEILGVKPALGRLIKPDDDSLTDGHRVAVLSYAFWQRRFGSSPSVLGHWVTIGRKQFQIIGVSAAPFSGVQPGYLTDVWLPLYMAGDPRNLADPDRGSVHVWGRLHNGVGRLQLREPLQASITGFLRERIRINPPRNLRGAQLQQFVDAPLHVRDASRGLDSLFRMQFRRPLWILTLICMLLLLIACANVANLMLARAWARDGEMALRVSLGAAKSRLIQQMLVEGGQLAFLAGALGLVFAAFAAPAIVMRLGSTEFPAWLNVSPNYRTVSFAALLSLLTTLLFGLVPAVRASSVSPNATLKEAAARRSSSMGSLRWMLAAQIGFSVAVLFLSGLLLLSFRKVIAVDLGFVSEKVVLFDIAPRDAESHRQNSGAELLDRLRRLPFVQAASISQQRPMGGDMVWISMPIIRLPGRANETARPREVPVSQGFFSAMQIPWIAGRDFLSEEIGSGSSPVIVIQAFVKKFLPGQNPIGQAFEKIGDDPTPLKQRIVGVVANARFNNLREAEGPTIYTPLRDVAGATLNIRTRSKAAPLIPSLRKEIESAAPEFVVRGSILLESQIDNTLISERLLALLAGFFSIVALVLAGVGLYGVINYTAVRRTREIGIRIALGARRSAVVRLVVSDMATSVIAGIAFGIVTGIGMARYLAAQLFEVKPMDFRSLAAPLICILIAAGAAGFPPAFRAASRDPLTALRHE
ncbi:MAG: ADOP family duplicated permease [Bryobacteraceae bacterium]